MTRVRRPSNDDSSRKRNHRRNRNIQYSHGTSMNYIELVTSELSRIRDANTFKHETALDSPQAGVVTVNGKPVVMMASNNYLGMANHPVVRKAAIDGIREYGY